jgi:Na+:H+ antiporter, NhaA family
MKLSKAFTNFFESERAGSIVLIVCTVLSLVLANSSFQTFYLGFWNYPIAAHSLSHWINDGLMAIFFLLIGLELEREVYIGELSSIKKALLPMIAALGGMLVPAGIYLYFTSGTPAQAGAGIPMATDIAFAIGVLSLLGSRVPTSLKVFLMALAVIDDLGAILVIAIFYSTSLSILNLGIALGIFALLIILNRLRVYILLPYLIGGGIMWYFMLHSGVHATITGVMLAFAIPFGNGAASSISYRLQHWLHKPVSFFILPAFALANTGLIIESNWSSELTSAGSLGIIAGLIIGKPLGIFVFSFAATVSGLCALPSGLRWKDLIGAGFLGGIGFTMSIFITLLAFQDAHVINSAKIAILIASLAAGILGFILLRVVLKKDVILN